MGNIMWLHHDTADGDRDGRDSLPTLTAVDDDGGNDNYDDAA